LGEEGQTWFSFVRQIKKKKKPRRGLEDSSEDSKYPKEVAMLWERGRGPENRRDVWEMGGVVEGWVHEGGVIKGKKKLKAGGVEKQTRETEHSTF